MSQLPILVLASKLTKSPTNVRKTSDPSADAQLEANIAQRGILQNLVGVPIARKKGHYRITAGGRRLDAVLICPPLSGPETMIVWTTKGTSNAIQEAQAGRDYRQAARS